MLDERFYNRFVFGENIFLHPALSPFSLWTFPSVITDNNWCTVKGIKGMLETNLDEFKSNKLSNSTGVRV